MLVLGFGFVFVLEDHGIDFLQKSGTFIIIFIKKNMKINSTISSSFVSGVGE